MRSWLGGLLKSATSNPTTSTAGIGGFLVILGQSLAAQFDSDPTTIAHWPLVVAAFCGLIAAMAAKDSKPEG